MRYYIVIGCLTFTFFASRWISFEWTTVFNFCCTAKQRHTSICIRYKSVHCREIPGWYFSTTFSLTTAKIFISFAVAHYFVANNFSAFCARTESTVVGVPVFRYASCFSIHFSASFKVTETTFTLFTFKVWPNAIFWAKITFIYVATGTWLVGSNIGSEYSTNRSIWVFWRGTVFLTARKTLTS